MNEMWLDDPSEQKQPLSFRLARIGIADPVAFIQKQIKKGYLSPPKPVPNPIPEPANGERENAILKLMAINAQAPESIELTSN